MPLPIDIINKWKLESVKAYTDESFMKIVSNDKTPILCINRDSSVGGYDGCNGFSSKVVIYENNNISFSGFLSTSRGCHPDVYWHNKFYKAIGIINNYTVQNGKLLLKKDSHVLMIFAKN